MTINRRDFIKGSFAAACSGYLAANAMADSGLGGAMKRIPGTAVRMAGSRAAGGNIVVFIQLKGGNDGLNTVYPLDGMQRTLYEQYRPTLALANTVAGLSPFATAGFGGEAVYEIGSNSDGNRYAFHPGMQALHQLYQSGKVAVLPGVHYPFPNRSHFASMGIWETANPQDSGSGGSGGWFGRYLNQAGFGATDVPGVMMGYRLNPMFTPTDAGLFAFRSLSQLRFPASGEVTLKADTYRRICEIVDDVDPAALPELLKIAQTGKVTVDKIQDYYLPGNGLDKAGMVEALMLDGDGRYRSRNPLIYDSPMNESQTPALSDLRLARDLRHVAAMIRSNVGAQFFHVSIGGFDTHSDQERDFFHSRKLQEISESAAALYRELDQSVTLPSGYTGYATGNLASKVVIVFFSEFGRTSKQNAVGASNAGTDHAASAPQFVLGGNVIGGQHGLYPQLDNPPADDKYDLRMTTDFRDLFGTILARHLSVPVADIGPGAGKILPATAEVDPEGNNYTAFSPMGFLP